MSETTTTTALPPGFTWTPEMLAAAKQALAQQALDEKAERERLRKVRQAQLDETSETFAAWLADVEATHEIQVWHKKKNGVATSEVRAHGFYVNGKQTVKEVDGRTREVKVTTFIEWDPKGGSAPDDLDARED